MTADVESKSKVLYIAGWGRSGTTILGNILGQVEGMFSVGEIRFLWDAETFRDRRCGCGVRFAECPIWQDIIAVVFGDRRPGPRPRLLPPSRRASLDLARLYAAIARLRRSEFVVDSSKHPGYLYLLSRTPSIELFVVHMVRDPHAVAHSWSKATRESDHPAAAFLPRYGPAVSATVWTAWNLALDAFGRRMPGRYLRLRFEDFVERPAPCVENILRMVGREGSELPFVSDHEIELEATHTVCGNPNRFRLGRVPLHEDEEWRGERRGWAVSAATGWLARRYGY